MGFNWCKEFSLCRLLTARCGNEFLPSLNDIYDIYDGYILSHLLAWGSSLTQMLFTFIFEFMYAHVTI
jgi:hypothetical protein